MLETRFDQVATTLAAGATRRAALGLALGGLLAGLAHESAPAKAMKPSVKATSARRGGKKGKPSRRSPTTKSWSPRRAKHRWKGSSPSQLFRRR